MSIKNISLSLFLFTIVISIHGQSSSLDCDKALYKTAILKADSLLLLGQYSQAYLQYNAAKVFCSDLQDSIQQYQDSLFRKIDLLRIQSDSLVIEAQEQAFLASNSNKIAIAKGLPRDQIPLKLKILKSAWDSYQSKEIPVPSILKRTLFSEFSQQFPSSKDDYFQPIPLLRKKVFNTELASVEYNLDLNMVVCGSKDGGVCIFPRDSLEKAWRFKLKGKILQTVILTETEVIVHTEDKISKWNKEGQIWEIFKDSTSRKDVVEVFPNGNTFLSSRNFLSIYNPKGKLIKIIPACNLGNTGTLGSQYRNDANYSMGRIYFPLEDTIMMVSPNRKNLQFYNHNGQLLNLIKPFRLGLIYGIQPIQNEDLSISQKFIITSSKGAVKIFNFENLSFKSVKKFSPWIYKIKTSELLKDPFIPENVQISSDLSEMIIANYHHSSLLIYQKKNYFLRRKYKVDKLDLQDPTIDIFSTGNSKFLLICHSDTTERQIGPHLIYEFDLENGLAGEILNSPGSRIIMDQFWDFDRQNLFDNPLILSVDLVNGPTALLNRNNNPFVKIKWNSREISSSHFDKNGFPILSTGDKIGYIELRPLYGTVGITINSSLGEYANSTFLGDTAILMYGKNIGKVMDLEGRILWNIQETKRHNFNQLYFHPLYPIVYGVLEQGVHFEDIDKDWLIKIYGYIPKVGFYGNLDNCVSIYTLKKPAEYFHFGKTNFRDWIFSKEYNFFAIKNYPNQDTLYVFDKHGTDFTKVYMDTFKQSKIIQILDSLERMVMTKIEKPLSTEIRVMKSTWDKSLEYNYSSSYHLEDKINLSYNSKYFLADRNMERVAEIDKHWDHITNIEISPNDKFILTSSEDGTVRLWPTPQTIYDWLSSPNCPINPLTEKEKKELGLS